MSEASRARINRPHEFITVGSRRWCLCCDLFQSKRKGDAWSDPAGFCPRNTPYAVHHDNAPRRCVTDEVDANGECAACHAVCGEASRLPMYPPQERVP